MAKRKTTVKRKLARGKKWFKLIAPKVFGEKELGEVLGTEDKPPIGRKVILPASDVTGDITKHNVKIKLVITSVEGEKAHTTVDGYEISNAFLQRVIRRKTTRVDQIVDITLKDGNKVRLKGLVVTMHRTNISKRTALRHKMEEILSSLSRFTFEGLVAELLSGKLQKEYAKQLNKIYPIKFFDIRKIEKLPKKKAEKLKEPEAESEEEPKEESE